MGSFFWGSFAGGAADGLDRGSKTGNTLANDLQARNIMDEKMGWAREDRARAAADRAAAYDAEGAANVGVSLEGASSEPPPTQTAQAPSRPAGIMYLGGPQDAGDAPPTRNLLPPVDHTPEPPTRAAITPRTGTDRSYADPRDTGSVSDMGPDFDPQLLNYDDTSIPAAESGRRGPPRGEPAYDTGPGAATPTSPVAGAPMRQQAIPAQQPTAPSGATSTSEPDAQSAPYIGADTPEADESREMRNVPPGYQPPAPASMPSEGRSALPVRERTSAGRGSAGRYDTSLKIPAKLQKMIDSGTPQQRHYAIKQRDAIIAKRDANIGLNNKLMNDESTRAYKNALTDRIVYSTSEAQSKAFRERSKTSMTAAFAAADAIHGEDSTSLDDPSAREYVKQALDNADESYRYNDDGKDMKYTKVGGGYRVDFINDRGTITSSHTLKTVGDLRNMLNIGGSMMFGPESYKVRAATQMQDVASRMGDTTTKTMALETENKAIEAQNKNQFLKTGQDLMKATEDPSMFADAKSYAELKQSAQAGSQAAGAADELKVKEPYVDPETGQTKMREVTKSRIMKSFADADIQHDITMKDRNGKPVSQDVNKHLDDTLNDPAQVRAMGQSKVPMGDQIAQSLRNLGLDARSANAYAKAYAKKFEAQYLRGAAQPMSTNSQAVAPQMQRQPGPTRVVPITKYSGQSHLNNITGYE